jgi:hypothetical protein
MSENKLRISPSSWALLKLLDNIKLVVLRDLCLIEVCHKRKIRVKKIHHLSKMDLMIVIYRELIDSDIPYNIQQIKKDYSYALKNQMSLLKKNFQQPQVEVEVEFQQVFL